MSTQPQMSAFLENQLGLDYPMSLGTHDSYAEAQRAVETFKAHDEQRLRDDQAHWTDEERVRVRAKRAIEELEEMFARDAAGEAKTPPGLPHR